MPGLRIVLLGAPTSLASTKVVGPHHAAVTYAGGTPKRASGSTWSGRVSQLGIGLSSCVLVGGYLNPAPPHQVGGRVLRDALGRHPSVDPRRWRPAGGPVTGVGLGIEPLDAKPSWHHAVVFDNSKLFLFDRSHNACCLLFTSISYQHLPLHLSLSNGLLHPPIQKLLHAVGVLSTDDHEACQRKKRATPRGQIDFVLPVY
jgi:hypothetical protein